MGPHISSETPYPSDPAAVLLQQSHFEELTRQLPDYLRAQRWFGGKAQPIRSLAVLDVIPFDARTLFLLVRVEYRDTSPENYCLPLVAVTDVNAVPEGAPQFVLSGSGPALYDALRNPAFLSELLAAVRDRRSFPGIRGELRADNTPVMASLATGDLAPKLLRGEQSNSSVLYDARFVLKLFRRVAEGINPDLEIGLFLTEKTSFRHVPALAGFLEYVSNDGASSSMGILQSFVPNQGDAWEFTLAFVARYFDSLAPASAAPLSRRSPGPLTDESLLQLASQPIPASAGDLVGHYFRYAELLGRRTAELHLALASSHGDECFDPAPYSPSVQHAFRENALELLDRTFRLLDQQWPSLSPAVQAQARDVRNSRPAIAARFRRLDSRPLTALRTRIHGDYHLGQVLVSNDDFVILDFEGEPARTLAERRRKRSPLQDVAGMLRSFHYAAFAPLLGIGPRSFALETYGSWAYAWQMWVSAAFLRQYLVTAGTAPFLPRDREELSLLLETHLLEKAVYELGYELNNRPAWVGVPLSGIDQIVRRGLMRLPLTA